MDIAGKTFQMASQCKGPGVGNFTKGKGDLAALNQMNQGESMEGGTPDVPRHQIVPAHRDHVRRESL